MIIPHEFWLFFVLAENEQRRYIGPFLVESVGESAVFHQVAFEVLVVNQVRNGQKPSSWVFNKAQAVDGAFGLEVDVVLAGLANMYTEPIYKSGRMSYGRDEITTIY